ncbi:hypothetical protein CDL15_Pgr017543 [Punica granatum]|uniref:Uncharacterized protein n=1 Tax=Punica granatum TaxID=22663 RepID=A0A218W5D5_PUNGR|nr:hypothetical protein CDL15_Pgr017543 [Punica granatum]
MSLAVGSAISPRRLPGLPSPGFVAEPSHPDLASLRLGRLGTTQAAAGGGAREAAEMVAMEDRRAERRWQWQTEAAETGQTEGENGDCGVFLMGIHMEEGVGHERPNPESSFLFRMQTKAGNVIPTE